MKLILILSAAILSVSLLSCEEAEKEVSTLVAVGGKKYGGEFRFMSSEKINSLASISCDDLYTSRLTSQIYEPLLKLDYKTMKAGPAVAESFEINENATIYTFKIRSGIFFHKDECFDGKSHELNADDVKFSLDMACSDLELNKVSYLLKDRIKGAKEFNEKTSKSLVSGGVSGIKKLDDNTIEISLIKPFTGFENILAHASLGIFPKEAYDKYKNDLGHHPVGTGPFQLDSMSDENIILKRNNEYWRKDDLGNQLPFLGKVKMNYVKDKKSEFMAFRNAEIDLVNEIPTESVEYILGSLIEAQDGKNIKHKVESTSSMNARYIGLSNTSEEFKNVDVRKAFNLAINRDELVQNALEGDGLALKNGFVPEILNYPVSEINGYKQDVNQANKLMSSAGFVQGDAFPNIDFYVNAVDGSKMHRMCSMIASQLKSNLNVNIKIKLCSQVERDEAIENGSAKMWVAGWIADYPDPENFLSLFYGENMDEHNMTMNGFKFNNSEFNNAYNRALGESDTEKRMLLLAKCDQVVINQAPVMPIYTKDHTVMINARVRNFEINEMEVLDLTNVFIKEQKKN